MRFSPTRIVLATLALIIGAVLALPMLLSRKADAADAPPKLEADARTGCLVAVEADAACLLAVAEAAQTQLPGSAPTPLAAWRASNEQLAYVLAPPPEAPWPHPQTIDRQRKYHLRP